MIIDRIEIYQSKIKLREPFKISLGQLTHAENVLVKVYTNEGLTGFGECSPFMTINGESMETCFVVGKYLGNALLGKDPLQISACTATMDAVIFANSSIKSAFGIALYDIAAQHAGMPLYAFIGGKKDKTLITDYTISIDTPAKMAADAVKIKENGFQVIKVKLGGVGLEDVARIQAIRNMTGQDIPLRIDANQGWDVETAIATLRALEPYNIQHCEEPIARWDFMSLSKVNEASRIPVMADESCLDHNDALRLISLRACDSFNIKLGKSGGIYKALKIADLAKKAGMKMQAGGFLESRLGFTATAHFALSNENIIFYDFDTPMMFEDDPVSGGITYERGGVVNVPDTPGLGAWVDESYLKKLPGFVIE
jgi:L-Ala-D/L-Glu epimerase